VPEVRRRDAPRERGGRIVTARTQKNPDCHEPGCEKLAAWNFYYDSPEVWAELCAFHLNEWANKAEEKGVDCGMVPLE